MPPSGTVETLASPSSFYTRSGKATVRIREPRQVRRIVLLSTLAILLSVIIIGLVIHKALKTGKGNKVQNNGGKNIGDAETHRRGALPGARKVGEDSIKRARGSKKGKRATGIQDVKEYVPASTLPDAADEGGSKWKLSRRNLGMVFGTAAVATLIGGYLFFAAEAEASVDPTPRLENVATPPIACKELQNGERSFDSWRPTLLDNIFSVLMRGSGAGITTTEADVTAPTNVFRQPRGEVCVGEIYAPDQSHELSSWRPVNDPPIVTWTGNQVALANDTLLKRPTFPQLMSGWHFTNGLDNFKRVDFGDVFYRVSNKKVRLGGTHGLTEEVGKILHASSSPSNIKSPAEIIDALIGAAKDRGWTLRVQANYPPDENLDAPSCRGIKQDRGQLTSRVCKHWTAPLYSFHMFDIEENTNHGVSKCINDVGEIIDNPGYNGPS